MEKDFDVVIDVLTKHKNILRDMVNRNMSSEFIGLNIMDDIRLDQIQEIDECLRVWKEYRDRRSTRTIKD